MSGEPPPTPEPVSAGTVELGEYFAVLRRRWLLLVVALLVGLVGAALWSFQRRPAYTATAEVLVRPIVANTFQPGVRVDQLVNMSTQRELARSPLTAGRAAAMLGGARDADELLRHLTVEVPSGSEVLVLRYADPDPAMAARAADALAAAYLGLRRQDATRGVSASIASLQRQIDSLGVQLARQQAAAQDPAASAAQRQSAAALAQVLAGQLATLRDQQATLARVDVTPGTEIQRASVPDRPSGPGHWVDLAIGLFLGLFAGVMLAFARDRTDQRLRGAEEVIRLLGCPVLAHIPAERPRRLPGRGRDGAGARPVVLRAPRSFVAEAYRTLRTKVSVLAEQRNLRTLAVVSACRGEGKSLVAANLAAALAEGGERVLLVSADLWRPRLHELFGLDNGPGLAAILDDAARNGDGGAPPAPPAPEPAALSEHLSVLVSGRPSARAAPRLDGEPMRRFLEGRRALAGLTLLDCPPALVVSDSLALAPLVDGVIVVVDARSSTRGTLRQLREHLDQVDARVVGAVLNRSRPSLGAAGAYSAYARRP